MQSCPGQHRLLGLTRAGIRAAGAARPGRAPRLWPPAPSRRARGRPRRWSRRSRSRSAMGSTSPRAYARPAGLPRPGRPGRRRPRPAGAGRRARDTVRDQVDVARPAQLVPHRRDRRRRDRDARVAPVGDRATGPSRSRPTHATHAGKCSRHCTPCTWWMTHSTGTPGGSTHGVKNGMPFWQSRTASKDRWRGQHPREYPRIDGEPAAEAEDGFTSRRSRRVCPRPGRDVTTAAPSRPGRRPSPRRTVRRRRPLDATDHAS